MQFLRDLSVRAKLFGGFGSVLLLAVVVGVVLMSQMGTINVGGVYIGTNALPSVQMTGQVARDAVDYLRAQVRYVVESQPSYSTVQKTAWTADGAQIQSLLKKYQSALTNASDRQLWQSVKTQWAAYVQQTAQIEVVGRAGASAAALNLLHSSDASFTRLSQLTTR